MVVSTSTTSRNINKILTKGFPKKMLENYPNFKSLKASSANKPKHFLTPQNITLTFRIKQNNSIFLLVWLLLILMVEEYIMSFFEKIK